MGTPLLSLQAVSKSYWRGPSEVRVLSDACLDVQAGEFIGVWGRRGAGKSLALMILNRRKLQLSSLLRYNIPV